MKVVGIIKASVQKIVGSDCVFVVEHPAEEKFGDYSTNAAMVIGGNPRENAMKLMSELEQDEQLMMVVEKMEIAGPGFINFWLKSEFLLEEIERVITDKNDYGKGGWGQGKRMLIDYSSPNIAKRFTIGHLRSTIIGQALVNLYKFSGWEVVGDNHLGDWGTQFGMIIAAIENGGLEIEDMSVDDLEELYVNFNKQIEEKPELKDLAREAFARLEKGDSDARRIWETAIKVSMEEFERIYEILGVKIDYAYGESTYESLMPEVISEAAVKKVAHESQGAQIIEFSDLPPAMLVKSNGTTTYLTRDLATVKFRQSKSELKSDLYVYEVGQEQTLHFKQVFESARKMGYVSEEKLVHVAHGLVLGKDGKKLSTRKGTAGKLEDWLGGMIEAAAKINPDSSQAVGVGAVKFFDLKHNPTSNYIFDTEAALQLQGNSGPYVQYAFARARSVLGKSNFQFSSNKQILNPKPQTLNPEETAILRYLYKFGEVVELSAREFSPNLLSSYLLELSGRFNAFYNQHQVIDSENRDFRVSLTAAVAQVLENGLKLLGIEPVEKM